jgi:hypothetical protein
MQRIVRALAVMAVLACAASCAADEHASDASGVPRPSYVRSGAASRPPATEGPTAGVTKVAKPSDTRGAAARARRARAAVRVTKLLVFVVENHSLDQMRREMPFTVGLGRRYGYATGYHAVTHPSLPNYLAITGGSTFGVTDDDLPTAHPLRGRSVFGQALSLHRTATLYADGMPRSCATANGGRRYAVKHNPWAYFVGERRSCLKYDVALPRLRSDIALGRLPNAGMVIPDLCHDAHDCGLSVADAWLREQLGPVLHGPDWRSGHLAVVITADEDDRRQDNLVLTTVLSPRLAGVSYAGPLNHYSLTRMYDEVLGAPLLRHAASATSMARAFGLAVGPSRR